MSLNRSRMGQKRDVDPYADDDEPKQQPKQKRKKKKIPTSGQPLSGNSLTLKEGPDVIQVVESEDWLEWQEGTRDRKTILNIQQSLSVPPNTSNASVFTHINRVWQGKLGWKAEAEEKDWNIPKVHFIDIGTSHYTAHREDNENCFLISKEENQFSATPIHQWYTVKPHIEDAASNLSGDALQSLMQKQRYHKIAQSDTLKSCTLTSDERNKLRKIYAVGKFTQGVCADEFADIWESVKSEPPGVNLLKRLFGQSGGFRMGIDQILVTLMRLGVVNESIEEEEARIYRNQQEAEDEEQDNVEDVEGVERIFDDDIEDAPDRDADQGNMDEETKAYSERLMAEGKQENTDQPNDELNDLLEDEAAESQSSDSEEDDDDEEAAEKSKASKKPGTKKPAGKKAAAKKAKQPSATNTLKRRKGNSEAAEIDITLKELFAKTSKVPFPAVHRQVILRHPDYDAKKQLAKEQCRSGHIKSEAVILQPFFQSVEKVMKERIAAMKGVINDNILTIPKQ